MIEADAPSTENVTVLSVRAVPAPPGITMVAPPEVPRNASRVQGERPRQRRGIQKSAARGIIKAGAP
jgi:hypothetical protein